MAEYFLSVISNHANYHSRKNIGNLYKGIYLTPSMEPAKLSLSRILLTHPTFQTLDIFAICRLRGGIELQKFLDFRAQGERSIANFGFSGSEGGFDSKYKISESC